MMKKLPKIVTVFFAASICASVAGNVRAAPLTLRTNDASVVAAFGEAGQGWWHSSFASTDSNTNYAAGGGYRSFLTFDLNNLALTGQTITAAKVRLQAFQTQGNTGISFFDVTSDPFAVNFNAPPLNLAIWNDLGSGTSYGTGLLPSAPGPNDILEFTLNVAAIGALNLGIGQGFFMIGINTGSNNNFWSSTANGNQQLVLDFVPSEVPVPAPGALALLGLGLLGLGATRRRKAA
jgi:hypothetical protein